MKRKIFLSLGGLLILSILAGCNQGSNVTLTPEKSIAHAHGFAVDVKDSLKLYIATHDGLFVLMNEKDLYKIGETSDDLMGFSAHPTSSNTFFSSGHASTGGNIGFQKSEDGGVTWKRIASGAQGPVDFHALAISGANPNLAYGWYGGMLQRSTDGGTTWEIINTSLSNVIALATNPQEENTVYATTTEGIKISRTKGEEWSELSEELKKTPVIFLAINPKDPKIMLSYSQELGLSRSSDGGTKWEETNKDFGEDIPLYAAFDSQLPEKIYLFTKNNAIYKSIDSGITWTNIQ